MKFPRLLSGAFTFVVIAVSAQAVDVPAIDLKWLDDAPPPIASGVSWGVQWPRGAVTAAQRFSLTAADGTALPLQTWPLAFWPDGTLKWSGFATVAAPAHIGFRLAAVEGDAAVPTAKTIAVRQSETSFEIDTGRLIQLNDEAGVYNLATIMGGAEVAFESI